LTFLAKSPYDPLWLVARRHVLKLSTRRAYDRELGAYEASLSVEREPQGAYQH